MKTYTLYENGDTFEVNYKRATEIEINKKYVYVDNTLYEVISKVKTNDFNVTEMNENIWRGIRERTKVF